MRSEVVAVILAYVAGMISTMDHARGAHGSGVAMTIGGALACSLLLYLQKIWA